MQPPADAFRLAGEIDGALDKVIAALKQHAAERKSLVIDCRGLERLDFGSAGQLLNAVSLLRQKGCAVEFFQPNHLVAALLVVMGGLDLARLTMRTH